MKNLLKVGIPALSLAACAGGAVVLNNLFDDIRAEAKQICTLSPTDATIEDIIQALNGTHVIETIARVFCTQVRILTAQGAVPESVLRAAPAPGFVIDYGTVVINGKPVHITATK